MTAWTKLKRWVKNSRYMVFAISLFKQWRHRNRKHDAVYDESYFEMVDRTSGDSAKIMAKTIIEWLNPKTVLDVGCGPGQLLSHLQLNGVEVFGLEYSSVALEMGRSRSLPIQYFDATDDMYLKKNYGRFDLAICLEVAQQLPPIAANELVAFLCLHSNTVLFSAPPCANDRNPKCPRPKSHWIQAFRECNFQFDSQLSSQLKSMWKAEGTAIWFHRDPMVFRSISK